MVISVRWLDRILSSTDGTGADILSRLENSRLTAFSILSLGGIAVWIPDCSLHVMETARTYLEHHTLIIGLSREPLLEELPTGML